MVFFKITFSSLQHPIYDEVLVTESQNLALKWNDECITCTVYVYVIHMELLHANGMRKKPISQIQKVFEHGVRCYFTFVQILSCHKFYTVKKAVSSDSFQTLPVYKQYF